MVAVARVICVSEGLALFEIDDEVTHTTGRSVLQQTLSTKWYCYQHY